MSFNFSIREAKAFHRSLEAQVTVMEGAGISLSTGAGIYRTFDPNNPPPTPEVPLPYGYRRADSYRSPILDDLVRTANGGVPSPVAPWAEWEGSIPANSRPDDVMVASTDVLTVTPEAMSEAGAAAAELVREAMNRSGVVSMVMEGRGLPHTRTINAGVIIDPSDIP